MQSGKLYLRERAFPNHDSVSVSIVGCLYAVRDLFVLERLNLFEFRRDGVIFVVVFAEEQYDRLASGNDFVFLGEESWFIWYCILCRSAIWWFGLCYLSLLCEK